MRQRTILKQASAVTFGMLLSASAWSVEIIQEFTRAFSGNDNQRIQLIFRLEGDGTSEYAVFAQGPSLIDGIDASEVLADPQINLLDENNDPIANNDNWGDDPSADRVSEVANFLGVTLDPLDSAMVRTLGAGLYTVVVVGADGGTGITRVGAADVSDIPTSIDPPEAGSCDDRLTLDFYTSIADQLDDGNTKAETDAIVGCEGVDDRDLESGSEIRVYTDTTNNTAIWVFFIGEVSFDSEFIDTINL